MPLVSGVIPTYDRAEYVGGAIDSVLAQTHDPVEVVVVDDGSTDDTREVLRGYDGDDRVRVLHNDQNRGIPYSMNRGVEAARGEYVGVFGDDDRWHPRKVERQLAALESAGDDHCGVYTEGVVTDGAGTVLEHVASGAEGDVYPAVLVEMSIVPHSSQLLRRECVEAVGGFDEEFAVACDWDLTVRLAERWPFAFVPEVLLERTEHAGNVSGDPEYDLRARRRMREKHADRIEAAGIEDAFRAAERREEGLLALARGRRREALASFLEALSAASTVEHLALALVAPTGSRGLAAARRLREAVGGEAPPDVELPTEALERARAAAATDDPQRSS